MALTSPDLLQAYDAAYTAMALNDRILSHHDREFVWFGVLIATDEALATHHIAKFRNAGGTDAEIEAVLAISGLCLGFSAYRFVENHWRPHLPSIDANSRFLSDLRKLAGGVPIQLVHMTAAAIHTCKASWDALEVQIIAAYADNVPEAELAESLSLAMFPGSIPYFVEAAGVWRDLIADGKVDASPEFREWAHMSGQGGFDETAKS